MIPSEWNAALDKSVSAKQAYMIVEREARSQLIHDPRCEHGNISTSDLVELLYPVGFARGDAGFHARKVIFKALSALATKGLSDCCTRGKPQENSFGRTVRPWLWHHPTVSNGETAYHGSISIKSCPTVTPRPTEGLDIDNDWIDANFDAVLWFLKRMTEKKHANYPTDQKAVA